MPPLEGKNVYCPSDRPRSKTCSDYWTDDCWKEWMKNAVKLQDGHFNDNNNTEWFIYTRATRDALLMRILILLEGIRTPAEGKLSPSCFFDRYTPEQIESAQKVKKIIIETSGNTEETSMNHFYVSTATMIENQKEPLATEEAVFKVKTKSGAIKFIDRTCRVYSDIAEYKANNKLPMGPMLMPRDGTYTPSMGMNAINTRVILDVGVTPSSTVLKRVMNIVQTATTIAGFVMSVSGVINMAKPDFFSAIVKKTLQKGSFILSNFGTINACANIYDKSKRNESWASDGLVLFSAGLNLYTSRISSQVADMAKNGKTYTETVDKLGKIHKNMFHVAKFITVVSSSATMALSVFEMAMKEKRTWSEYFQLSMGLFMLTNTLSSPMKIQSLFESEQMAHLKQISENLTSDEAKESMQKMKDQHKTSDQKAYMIRHVNIIADHTEFFELIGRERSTVICTADGLAINGRIDMSPEAFNDLFKSAYNEKIATIGKVAKPRGVAGKFIKEVGVAESKEFKEELKKVAEMPLEEQRDAARKAYERITGTECGPKFDQAWDDMLAKTRQNGVNLPNAVAQDFVGDVGKPFENELQEVTNNSKLTVEEQKKKAHQIITKYSDKQVPDTAFDDAWKSAEDKMKDLNKGITQKCLKGIGLNREQQKVIQDRLLEITSDKMPAEEQQVEIVKFLEKTAGQDISTRYQQKLVDFEPIFDKAMAKNLGKFFPEVVETQKQKFAQDLSEVNLLPPEEQKTQTARLISKYTGQDMTATVDEKWSRHTETAAQHGCTHLPEAVISDLGDFMSKERRAAYAEEMINVETMAPEKQEAKAREVTEEYTKSSCSEENFKQHWEKGLEDQIDKLLSPKSLGAGSDGPLTPDEAQQRQNLNNRDSATLTKEEQAELNNLNDKAKFEDLKKLSKKLTNGSITEAERQTLNEAVDKCSRHRKQHFLRTCTGEWTRGSEREKQYKEQIATFAGAGNERLCYRIHTDEVKTKLANYCGKASFGELKDVTVAGVRVFENMKPAAYDRLNRVVNSYEKPKEIFNAAVKLANEMASDDEFKCKLTSAADIASITEFIYHDKEILTNKEVRDDFVAGATSQSATQAQKNIYNNFRDHFKKVHNEVSNLGPNVTSQWGSPFSMAYHWKKHRDEFVKDNQLSMSEYFCLYPAMIFQPNNLMSQSHTQFDGILKSSFATQSFGSRMHVGFTFGENKDERIATHFCKEIV